MKHVEHEYRAKYSYRPTHFIKFDISCTVHRSQLHKQINEMHFCMYLFYNFYALYMFRNDYFVHDPSSVSRLEPTVRQSS